MEDIKDTQNHKLDKIKNLFTSNRKINYLFNIYKLFIIWKNDHQIQKEWMINELLININTDIRNTNEITQGNIYSNYNNYVQ